MAVVNATTVAHYKEWTSIPIADSSDLDTRLGVLIPSLSRAAERFTNRRIALEERTYLMDVSKFMKRAFVPDFPLTDVSTVHNEIDQDFSAGSLLTEGTDYSVRNNIGRVSFKVDLDEGPDALQIVATGGLAVDDAAMVEPTGPFYNLCLAVMYQIDHLLMRRTAPGGQTVRNVAASTITVTRDVQWLPMVVQLLEPFRVRRMVA